MEKLDQEKGEEKAHRISGENPVNPHGKSKRKRELGSVISPEGLEQVQNILDQV